MAIESLGISNRTAIKSVTISKYCHLSKKRKILLMFGKLAYKMNNHFYERVNFTNDH